VTLPRNTVLVGDAATILRRIPDASVHCIVTSPPYFGHRDYGADGQIGLEPSVHDWVAKLTRVTDQLGRVLARDGAFWLNVGDTYSRHRREGAPEKSLLLAPERLVLALAGQGWIVRNKVAWIKPHPLPAPFKDRLTAAWEAVYLLVRSRRYHFDLDAIRLPHQSARRRSYAPRGPEPRGPGRPRPPRWAGPRAGNQSGLGRLKELGRPGHALGKNPTDVWSIAQSRNHGGHHRATFPEALIERPILATCPERVCTSCGSPWRRHRVVPGDPGDVRPGCDCRAPWKPGIVLDPFMGSGTTAVVAERHGRDWLGIELNPDFATLAEARVAAARHQRAHQ
jgi:DNA modification methylase